MFSSIRIQIGSTFLAIGLMSACSGSQGNSVAAAKSNLKYRLYPASQQATVARYCDEVKSVEQNGTAFIYCAKAGSACTSTVKVCPAIYVEGANPNDMCSDVCEDQAVSPEDCGGTVSVMVASDGSTSNETYTKGSDACLPSNVPGETPSGCPKSDPECVLPLPTPSAGCEDAHVQGVCGNGEAKPSCCGVEIPALSPNY